MTEPREHTRPLRDFRFEHKPELISKAGPITPWDATVTVTVVNLAGIGKRFEVTARWHGLPLPGSPPADQPVWATDVYMADDADLARAIALRAAEDLAVPHVPDLRGAAQRIRQLRT